MNDAAEYLRRALQVIGDEPFALIGGQALLVHGLARQTEDIDLLVGTTGILTRSRWPAGVPEVVLRRAADVSDPLDGVAAIEPETDDDGSPIPGSPVPVEMIVLARSWARAILARATGRGSIAGVELPVVDLPDLVILKAYAGGPIDRADVATIAERADWPEIKRLVEARLADGPRTAARNWRRWLPLLDVDDP